MLGVERPNALGRKFFTKLMARRLEASTDPVWIAFLCPNLQTLEIRYRRWCRQSETGEATGVLRQVVDSRRRTSTPLRSLRIWYSMDLGAMEMCDDAIEDQSSALSNGTVLQDINPRFGPTTGSTNILLTGLNMPSTRAIFARFGNNVTLTVRAYLSFSGMVSKFLDFCEHRHVEVQSALFYYPWNG